MKRIIAKFFAVIILLAISLNASAYDFEVDGIYYNIISLADLTCEVKQLNYNSGPRIEVIDIPENVVYNNRTIDVIAVGDSAFYGDFRIREVKLPKSIKRIGKSAFNHCEELEYISMPNQVDSIHELAFIECDKLTNIKLPDSLKYIGVKSFYSTGLTTIELPKSVKKIDDMAFGYNYTLKDLKLSDSLQYIGQEAFTNCRKINHLYIPKNVDTIQDHAFRGCFATVEVDEGNKVYDSRNNSNAIIRTKTNNLIFGTSKTIIPNTVTKIGDYAFQYNSFDKLILPNSITQIGEHAFYECSINQLVIPNTVEELNLCFTGAKINKLEISDGDKTLNLGVGAKGYYYKGNYQSPKGLFYLCELSEVYIGRDLNYVVSVPTPSKALTCLPFNKGLTSVTIGNKVTEIGYMLCAGTSLETLTIYEGCKIIKKGAFSSTNITSLEIPSSIKIIYEDAFNNVPLSKIVFKDGNDTLYIADNIFKKCENLTIGRNLNSDIETGVFPNVKEVILTSKVKSIQPNFFKNSTNLEYIDFGSNIRHIGDNAFAGCDNIKQIFTRNIIPPVNALFSNKVYMNAIVYVPQNAFERYQTDVNWRNFWNISKGSFSSINEVEIKQSLYVDVYTLQGSLVRKGVKREDATQGLPQGVYVIGGEKVIVK